VVKGIGLVAFALLFSKFALPRLFHSVAKLPEVTVLGALGWCFLVVMTAAWLGLSREMGALIAGVSVAAFPYNLEVVARIIALRDFFITLFFVSLGAKIQRPDADLVGSAMWVVGFVIVTRFLSLTPLLYLFRTGTRVSFIPALNLSQVSEFSLVICALGVSLGHIDERVLSIVLLAMVITAVISTYAIQYNHQIYMAVRPLLLRLGMEDLDAEHPKVPHAHGGRSIFFLGFSRYASSLLQELLQRDPDLGNRVGVVDFNPQVKRELDRRGIFNIYGDISHTDTLHHAGAEHAQVVLCTIPDAILKGVTNVRLLHKLRTMNPTARIIVTAEFFYAARELYEHGADFVFVPRLMSLSELADAVVCALEGDISHLKARSQGDVMAREQLEVLP
jgi:voltage-gated potassium channel Kch